MSATAPGASRALLTRLNPRVGELRPVASVDLSEELAGRPLRLTAPASCASQAEYISYFDDQISVLQTEAALERCTYELCLDSAAETTQTALEEQFAFLLAVRDRTSQANDAVRRIRNVKAQLADRAAKMPATQRAGFKTKADAYSAQLSAVEAEVYQVKNQSGQDPLNYPIRLNNKIAALGGVAGGADARPTEQTRSVFRILSAQLDEQLARLSTAMRGLSPLNADIQRAGLPAIVPSTEELKTASPSRAGG